MAVGANDWFLFLATKEDDDHFQKLGPGDLLKQFSKQDPNEGEHQLYCNLYEEYEAELKKAKDNYHSKEIVDKKIGEWAKSRHLKTFNFSNKYNYFDLIAKKIKTRVPPLVHDQISTDDTQRFRKEFFKGFFLNIMIEKVNSYKIPIISLCRFSQFHDLKYNLSLSSVFKNNQKNEQTRYFVSSGIDSMHSVNPNQNFHKIKAYGICMVEESWLEELPEPLKTLANYTRENPKTVEEIEDVENCEPFDEVQHEKNAATIIFRGIQNESELTPELIINDLKSQGVLGISTKNLTFNKNRTAVSIKGDSKTLALIINKKVRIKQDYLRCVYKYKQKQDIHFDSKINELTKVVISVKMPASKFTREFIKKAMRVQGYEWISEDDIEWTKGRTKIIVEMTYPRAARGLVKHGIYIDDQYCNCEFAPKKKSLTSVKVEKELMIPDTKKKKIKVRKKDY